MTSPSSQRPPDSPPCNNRVTELLHEWRGGNPAALDELTPMVYNELRGLAHHLMRHEPRKDLLQTTALVHEAYLRLVGDAIPWKGREHFFAIAASVMRRILVDFARRRNAEKRGGGRPPISLEETALQPRALSVDGPTAEVLALDQALGRLHRFDPRKSQILEMRFFGGMTIRETACALDISHSTVERDLEIAKAWLSRSLKDAPS